LVQRVDAFLQRGDLDGELLGESDFHSDVVGQLDIVQAVLAPQGQGLVGGVQQRLGLVLAQAPRLCRYSRRVSRGLPSRLSACGSA
jgi:hypothetical protein